MEIYGRGILLRFLKGFFIKFSMEKCNNIADWSRL